HFFLSIIRRLKMISRDWSTDVCSSDLANARTGRAAVDPAAEPVAEGLAYIDVPGRAGGAHMAQVEYANRLQTLIRKYDASGTCEIGRASCSVIIEYLYLVVSYNIYGYS